MLLGSDIGMVGYMRLGESMNQEVILRIIVERDPLRWACGIGIFALTFSKSVRFICSEAVSSGLMEQEWNLPMKVMAGSSRVLAGYARVLAGSDRVLAGYSRVCPGFGRIWPGLTGSWPDVAGSWPDVPGSDRVLAGYGRVLPDMPGSWPDVCPGLGQIWNL
ncbi:hypothetical protein Tco_0993587 [Tanacetum coccineum]